jgi:hypothetical protein
MCKRARQFYVDRTISDVTEKTFEMLLGSGRCRLVASVAVLRGLVIVVVVATLMSPVHAQMSASSVGRGGDQTAASQSRTAGFGSNVEMIAGAALLVGGVAVAFYGFGNPTGPPPDDTQKWIYPHRTGVGEVGIAVAVAGGVLAWHGMHRALSPSVEVGPHRIAIQKRVAF